MQYFFGRFYKFLLFLGYAQQPARDMKAHVFCKVVVEFALEYKTTRDKVLQMREKKANQRERKKTRGKMIVETEKYKQQHPSNQQVAVDSEEAKLQQLLRGGTSNGSDVERNGNKHLPGMIVRKRRSLGERACLPPVLSVARSFQHAPFSLIIPRSLLLLLLF